MAVRTLGPRSTPSPLMGTATSAATKADSLIGRTPTTRSRAPAWARPLAAVGLMGTVLTVLSSRAVAHTVTTAGQGTDGRRQKPPTQAAWAVINEELTAMALAARFCQERCRDKYCRTVAGDLRFPCSAQRSVA